MKIYEGYEDPFKLEVRGIDRLSVVYGIVPVHLDGRPLREDGSVSGRLTEYPRASTLYKAAKGIVATATREQEVGLYDDVKVMWQPTALGRSSLSRGVGRWPSTAYVFTSAELIKEVRRQVEKVAMRHLPGFDTVPIRQDVNEEALVQLIDETIDNPLGNHLMVSVLNQGRENRYKIAHENWEIAMGYKTA